MTHRRSLLTCAFAAVAGAKVHGLAFAQAKSSRKRPVIGRLNEGLTTPTSADWFREAMYALGHKDFALEIRDAAGQPARLPAMAKELVDLPVDVIWTAGTYATEVAQQATQTIPIVMVSADAVRGGIVTNLARPGGNVTGLSLVGTELIYKRLELIKELFPRASNVVAVCLGPDALQVAVVKAWWNDVQKAAAALRMSAQYADLDVDSSRWDDQFSGFARQQGTVVSPIESPALLQKGELLAELSLKHRLPAVYAFPGHVKAGGLCSYGVALKYLAVRPAYYVSRILRGSKAGDLPVELPTTYALSINMKTASAMGLTVSRRLQLRADELM
jgi:putative ABC transport system substrate-binding protein